MNKKILAILTTSILSVAAVIGAFVLLQHWADNAQAVRAAPVDVVTPAITELEPNYAYNDMDTFLVISGTGFTAELSGTEVLTAPLAYLGSTALEDVTWITNTQLNAMVPWGLDAGIYSLTVVNPDGISVTLQAAFTITNGLGEFVTNGPYGGMATQLKLKLGDPNSIYALMYGAGLFISEDGAGSWAPIHDHDWALQLDFDAQNSNILYLGPDSNDMYRSMDNGTTWTRLLEDFSTQNGCFQTYPVAHPSQSGEVYVGIGSCGDIYLEAGEGGVFHSTDFGDNWSAYNTGLSDLDVQTLAIHPNSPNTLLAGTLDGNLFYSTNGGDDWVFSTQLTGTVSRLYFNPYQPLEAWAITRSDTDDRGYLYRSTNLTDWTPLNLNVQPQGGPIQAQMAFLPNTVWVASINVYFSTNSGASWDQLNGLNHSATSIAISPDNPQVIYVGTDFGVEKTSDGGSTWEEAVDGLAALVPSAVAVSPDNLDRVYVKTYQGIFVSQNGGGDWQYLDHGTGGYNGRQSLTIDQFNPAKIYLNLECQGEFCIEISSDRGAHWDVVTGTLPLTYTGWSCSSFAIVPSPHTPGRVLVGASLTPPGGGDVKGIFYRSDDYGESWSSIEPPQSLSRIRELAYDAFNPNLIYAGTQGTGLWRSTNDGDSWEYVPVASVQSPISIAAIEVHPNVPDRVFIRTYSYANSPNPEPELWVSNNAGDTWQPLAYVFLGVDLLMSPPLPGQSFYSLYTGCEPGLCRSFSEGLDWAPIEGIPRPEILSAVSDGERSVIYMGTPGGLVYSTGKQTSALINAIPGRGSLGGGGVYRLTTILPTNWVYLPSVMH